MENFTPISALIGGAMIGLSAVLLMALNGRVAGISGIFGGLLQFQKGEMGWRLAFITGLLIGPFILPVVTGTPVPHFMPSSTSLMAIGGFIVGFGTAMGGGCTSGHGVCGMARGSKRSFIATVTFMITGFATLYVIRHVVGG